MAWRPAKSLLKLREQINALAPKRSKLSDGTVGNLEHSARTSDHNPDANGVVKAMDITHDPAHGVDTYALAELLRLKRDKRIKYVISNGRIWNSEQSPFKWRKYNGSNRHDHHVHVSVKAAKSFYDDASAWDITLNPPKGKVVAERPVLKKGATGKDVADLQKLLEIPVTKTFDKATDDAVREFQKQSGLTVDGIVGPYTWQELE